MKKKRSLERSKITHVVLSGGVGSRLWPLSRKSKPKQYLEIFNSTSLFQSTLERNSSYTNELIVVGNTDNQFLSEAILIKKEFTYIHIIEAIPRNTTAAIAFAAFESEPDTILIVTPSDHIIEGQKTYESALENARVLAEEGSIVTFGIKPTKPETGYGYIEYCANDVESFREKPDEKTAKEFLDAGNFLWNSGIFCFKASVFIKELKKLAPEIYETSKKSYKECLNTSNNHQRFIDFKLSEHIPAISVDYAIMEQSDKIKVVPTEFEWSDLGSFEAVYDYLKSIGHPVDKNGNMVIGTEKHTSFIGIKNTIFVNTPDANLILNKENSQEVKDLYAKLEDLNSPLIK